MVVFIGLLAVLPSAHALLTNGDFDSGLDGWQTEGLVLGDGGVGTLSEGAEAPVLYQPVAVTGYVYELRFDLDLSGLSASAGSGQLDMAQVLLYLGTDAASLTPDGAADEAVLIEADSSGLLTVAENAQVVANAALGAGWYSAVVEVISDFEAIAPACRLIDGNESVDSSMGIDNVELRALDRGRFANISNRGGVGTGANVMIPGFVIEGPTNKSLLIRGSGPTLGELGVPGTITDPQLKLYYKVPGQPPPPDELKGDNDNWEEVADLDALKAAMVLVGAFEFTEGSLDAAFLAEDLVPGAYTVEVSGVGGVTGVSLAEVYDLGASADGPTELVNISNRGFVGIGSSVQIPGFVIRGNRGRVVLVRAVGPTLGGFGVAGTIEDPFLNLYDLTDPTTPLFSNDNWEDAVNTTEVEATALRVGAFPLDAGSKDASILASLPPGNYTAVARGVEGATGVALVEVYVVTDNQRPTAYGNSLVVTSDVANVLPMDEILGNDIDPENDVLSVSFFTQPDEGTITMNEDGELVYTSPDEFWGLTAFSYRASDGEYESVPATIALEVRPEGVIVWQGGSSDDFSDPANWLGGVAPGADDPVWIAPEGGGTVVVDADTEVASIWVGDKDSAVTLNTNRKNLTVAGGMKVQPGSTFVLDDGTFDAGQDVMIDGKLIWTRGTMAGDSNTIIGENATADLSSGQLRLEDNHGLINRGDVTQTGAGHFYTDGGSESTITNAADATWNLDLNNGTRISYQDQSSAINWVNDGTMIKTDTTSSIAFGHSAGTSNFTNNGVVSIEGGTLQWAGSGTGTHEGELSIASGAKALFSNGTHVFGSEATISDTGTVELRLADTVTLQGAHSFESLILFDGTLNAAGEITTKSFSQTNATFNSPSDLIVTDSFSWTGGIQTGSGTTIIGPEASGIAPSSRKDLEGGRNFTNFGEFTQSSNAYFYSRGGSQSTVTNAAGATWNLSVKSGTTFAYNDTSSTMNFVNEGAFSKVNDATAVYFGTAGGSSNFANSGSLSVSGGDLGMRGSGTGTFEGSVSIAAPGELWFVDGTHTFSAGTQITGDGLFKVDGRLVDVTLTDGYALKRVHIQDGVLNALGENTVETFSQAGGIYSSDADLTVTDTFEWRGGSQAGTGTTIIADGASAAINWTTVYLPGGRNLTNLGTVTQTGSGAIRSSLPGVPTITNASGAHWIVDMVEGRIAIANIRQDQTMNFINEGTLTKRGTALNYLCSNQGNCRLTSTGVIDVEEGTLAISARTYVEVSGRLSTSSGAALRFGFGLVTLPIGTEISGEGSLQVGGATVTLMDSYDLAEVEVLSGVLVTNGALTIGNLTQSLGTITGAADLTVTGTLDWDRGVMAGEGTTIIDQGASAVIDSLIVNLEGGRNILNKGTLTQSGQASIAIAVPSTTSTITNASGAQWTSTMDNGTGIAYSSSGTSTLEFFNAGTLTKNGAETRLGHSNGKLDLTNTGTIDVVAGTLLVEGNGTSLLDAAGTLRLNTDGATKPLVWNGALSIAGTLEVILAEGYTPATGTTVRLIDFTSSTGTFNPVVPPQGRTIAESYETDGLDVTIN